MATFRPDVWILFHFLWLGLDSSAAAPHRSADKTCSLGSDLPLPRRRSRRLDLFFFPCFFQRRQKCDATEAAQSGFFRTTPAVWVFRHLRELCARFALSIKLKGRALIRQPWRPALFLPGLAPHHSSAHLLHFLLSPPGSPAALRMSTPPPPLCWLVLEVPTSRRVWVAVTPG